MHAPATVTPAPQGAVRLGDWGVIRAIGPEARSFLHGQLTQDIEHLPAGQARLAGYCSAKGRLLATFVVWSCNEQETLLACSADLLDSVLKRLSMFVLRAKCKLSDASAEWPLWGITGEVAADAPGPVWGTVCGEGRALIRLPDAGTAGIDPVARYLCAGAPPADLAALDIEDWRWLEVRSGVARIVAATSEQFVPQMVNLELVAGVNFQKGCYPGQEIVARSQYRGTLKRRLFVVDGDGEEPLRPGQEIFHSAEPDQPAGSVVLGATSTRGSHSALVSLKIAAVESGGLHSQSSSGPLVRVGTLPYAIPTESA